MKKNILNIDVDVSDAVQSHIESLQNTLTKRNERIAYLEAQLEAEGESPYVKQAINRAFRDGYGQAVTDLRGVTKKLEESLKQCRDDAFKVWRERNK